VSVCGFCWQTIRPRTRPRLSLAFSRLALELCRQPHWRSYCRRAFHRPGHARRLQLGDGTFEMWDAAGIASTVARMKALGVTPSARVEAMLAAGQTSWYASDGSAASSPHRKAGTRRQSFRPRPRRRLPSHAQSSPRNAGASLVDLGDGIGCIELHSLKNAIGGDVLSMISAVLNPPPMQCATSPASLSPGTRRQLQRRRKFDAAPDAGAGRRVGRGSCLIHGFQQMTAAIKFCPRPVVVAPSASRSAEARRFACTPLAPTPRRDLHRLGRGGRWPHPRRRRHQGNVAPRR